MAGKTSQSFSELKNHYFDKYDTKTSDEDDYSVKSDDTDGK